MIDVITQVITSTADFNQCQGFGRAGWDDRAIGVAHLDATLQFRGRANLFFAGQITGVEGYAGNIATGLLAGLNATRQLCGEPLLELPHTTILGALCHYIANANPADFQPMKANYGLLPPLEGEVPHGRRERAAAYSRRALADLDDYFKGIQETD